jgi:lactate dehydrogenase-like 2-hydroxyacid dehydrogenase
MMTAFYDAKPYDRQSFKRVGDGDCIQWRFHEFRLTAETAASTQDADAVCVFVSDRLNSACLEALAKLGVRLVAFLINTSRGKLIDTDALIESLKQGHLGGVALDVYEEEEGIFFEDHSGEVLQDDELARLMTFSQCPHHRASGLPHPRSAFGNRARHARQRFALPRWHATRGRTRGGVTISIIQTRTPQAP